MRKTKVRQWSIVLLKWMLAVNTLSDNIFWVVKYPLTFHPHSTTMHYHNQGQRLKAFCPRDSCEINLFCATQ